MTAPSRFFLVGFLVLISTSVDAGQMVWTSTGAQPSLVLNLGDSLVKKTVQLPSGAAFLNLTVKKFLLDDAGIQLIWKNDGELWMSVAKKIPGDETTEKVALPPGRQIVLEISTFGGTPVAKVTLLRK